MFEVEGKLLAKAMQLSTSETNIIPPQKKWRKGGGRWKI